MKCHAISDTHTMHDQVKLSGGDLLVHCGDSTYFGQPEEVYAFLEWFAKQDYTYKVFISGNHELGWEPLGEGFDGPVFTFRGEQQVKGLDVEYQKHCGELGLIYLKDSSVTIEGFKIYGSPYQRRISLNNQWAFNYSTEEEYDWSHIPLDTDLLLTHSPPYDILDDCGSWALRALRVGSIGLLNRIKEVKPKVHCFGHIHQSYGRLNRGGTKFINAAICTDRYDPWNKPVLFYLK